jgi:GNAT superfamily N-acetyltransferase
LECDLFVTVAIELFRNTDLPAICEIWNQHHRVSGHQEQLAIDRMELFVPSKLFFDARLLLLAKIDDRPVGFIHLCPIPNAQFLDAKLGELAIAALCVVPSENEQEIAAKLFQAAKEVCISRDCRRCVFRPALPQCSFYVGLGPADSLAGTLSSEERVCRWLAAAGFKPALPTTLWEIDLLNFRVPGDRIQMLVRRRSLVDRQIQEPDLPWWQSCVLGHTETVAFHLTDRIEKRTLQELILWSLAPSLSGTAQRVVWLWPPSMDYSPIDAPVEISPVDRLLFLLAESLRELQTEQVDTLRTVTHSEATQIHQVLHRLGFQAVESGMVFENLIDDL